MGERTRLERRRRPKGRIAGLKGEAILAESYYSKTVGRALDVLDCFNDDRPLLSLKEIGRLVEMSEPSLYRMLLTLELRGYLVREDDGAYRLSRKLLFGKLTERAEEVMRKARPELERLVVRFNETASLGYLFGDHIEEMDSVESFHEIRLSSKPGRILPPHCSAIGKAITAFQEPALMERILELYGLPPRIENTITNRRELMAEFARVRAAGYGADREETVAGAICIGAPVHSSSGRVMAAISVSGPKVRMQPPRELEIIAGVVEAAQRITSALLKTRLGPAA